MNRTVAPRTAGDTPQRHRSNRNLAAEAATAGRHGPRRPGSAAAPRPNHAPLTIALAPLTLLGIACSFSAVQRAAAAIIYPNASSAAESARFGRMTADDAKRYANDLCFAVTGAHATPTEVNRQSAYSWRRHEEVREWNVLCDTDRGQYLLRINADTGHLYGINRMDLPAATGSDDDATAGEPSRDDSGPITRQMAEARARQYLRLAGIPDQGLRQIDGGPYQAASGEQTALQWNFTFQHLVPGYGERLLKISIDGRSGALEHVWNPISAM